MRRGLVSSGNNNTAFYIDFVPYCTSKCCVDVLRFISTHARPKVITSDGGSYFTRKEVQTFAVSNNILRKFYIAEAPSYSRFFEQLILEKWSYQLRQNEDNFEGNGKCKQQSNR